MFTYEKFKTLLLITMIGVSLFLFIKKPFYLGLDLQGGMQVILEAKETENMKADLEAINGVLAVIRNRVDGLGVSEPVIRKKGDKQVSVELPGVKDPERAIELIGKIALLEFREGQWAPGDVSSLSKEKLDILVGKDAELKTYNILDDSGNVVSERQLFLKKPALTGADLKSAVPGTDNFGEPVVNIEFTAEGSKKFYEVTSRSVGKPLAIVLDGVIISAPNISEPIPGPRAVISGGFSIQEMRDLVIQLKAGALPIPVEVISKKVIGPTLGAKSIQKSKIAGIIGIVLVCIFMILFYRFAGILACGALFTYLLFTLAIIKLIPITLTLPGLAGIILTVGMAVDANVIIFERIKEERALGRPAIVSIKNGFSRAFVTIIDANITTLLAAFVLFWLGTGTIKGFAVTLTLGILVSMVSAIFITRIFLEAFPKPAFPAKKGPSSS